MDLKNTKLAIVTDDGSTVSSHFGKAHFYEVITLVDGKPVSRERRPKAGHHTFAPQNAQEAEHHHSDDAHTQRHQAMVQSITDCTAVVARGMGQGAVEHLTRSSLIPILTDLHLIDEVIGAIATSSLEHDARRVHHH